MYSYRVIILKSSKRGHLTFVAHFVLHGLSQSSPASLSYYAKQMLTSDIPYFTAVILKKNKNKQTNKKEKTKQNKTKTKTKQQNPKAY